MSNRLVIALGGNALLRRGDRPDIAAQRANLAAAMPTLAAAVGGNEAVITHGNGPQIGLLALQAAALSDVAMPAFDVLGAESEGLIGYMIEQELRNALPERNVATLLTQVVVDADDPAFDAPNKPIGPVYDEATARRLARDRGWTVARDGPAWRRVVASPEPRCIVEIAAIRCLLDAGFAVVCVGGGGIPVSREPSGALRGVDAVIDKDLAAAHLAIELGAARLLMLTDVGAIYDDWGSERPWAIRATNPTALRARRFAPGSMGPKVEAACRFAERGGIAMVGALTEAVAILAGDAGTRIAIGTPEVVRSST